MRRVLFAAAVAAVAGFATLPPKTKPVAHAVAAPGTLRRGAFKHYLRAECTSGQNSRSRLRWVVEIIVHAYLLLGPSHASETIPPTASVCRPIRIVDSSGVVAASPHTRHFSWGPLPGMAYRASLVGLLFELKLYLVC